MFQKLCMSARRQHWARGRDKVMWSDNGIVAVAVHNDVHRLGETSTSLVRGALFMYSVGLSVALFNGRLKSQFQGCQAA